LIASFCANQTKGQ